MLTHSPPPALKSLTRPSPSGSGPAAPGLIDFEALMQAHLARVFDERNARLRLETLRELYSEDATLFEPHGAATGHDAISAAIGSLQASLPPDFVFTAVGAAVGHHGVARLQWRAGPHDGPAAVTGTDVAHVEDGRIKALYVFLDPAPR